MMRAWMILLLCLLVVSPADALRRSADLSVVPPGHILFIGAHPDDEVVAAPLLGWLCADGPSTCSFLVMTRGEGGGDPTVRQQEMIDSAAIFRGRVIQWTFPDVLSGVSAAWRSPVAQISAVIAAERPATVITLDPAHGTTCHEAHREIGRLVIEAIEHLGQSAPPLFLLQTAARLENGVYRFGPGALPALVFDASLYWRYAVDSAASHRSQFPEALLDALRATPPDERKVWLSRAGLPLRPLRLCGESP